MPDPWHIYLPSEIDSLPYKCNRPLGYVYVLDQAGFSVKVGETTNPHTRIGQHLFQSKNYYGFAIERILVSDCHLNPKRNETLLKNLLGAENQGLPEVFPVPFDEVVPLLSGLDFSLPQDKLSQVQDEGRAARDELFAFLLGKDEYVNLDLFASAFHLGLRSIRVQHRKHRAELALLDPIRFEETPPVSGGPPYRDYFLTRRQAAQFLSRLHSTPLVADFRRRLIQVKYA